jgi:hypothetical protein
MALAFPTDLVLGDIQRFAFAFPKASKVIGVAGLTGAFDLFPTPFRSHKATEGPVIHLTFDDLSDELRGFKSFIFRAMVLGVDEFAQTRSMASLGELRSALPGAYC